VREVLEETDVHCCALSLVGVFDSRFCGTQSPHHLYQFTFLCEPLNEQVQEKPTHALEVLDMGWFPEGGLPEAIDPGHVTRISEAYRVWHGDRRVFFDGAGFSESA
jgi:ADP-ribose pyrophosphatase YjhB (NUDIX family)